MDNITFDRLQQLQSYYAAAAAAAAYCSFDSISSRLAGYLTEVQEERRKGGREEKGNSL